MFPAGQEHVEITVVLYSNISVAEKCRQRQHCVKRCQGQQIQEPLPPPHQHNKGHAVEDSSSAWSACRSVLMGLSVTFNHSRAFIPEWENASLFSCTIILFSSASLAGTRQQRFGQTLNHQKNQNRSIIKRIRKISSVSRNQTATCKDAFLSKWLSMS